MAHRTMQARPDVLLKAIAPSRAGIGIAVEGVFPWYGLADLWAHAGMPCVLGHALSMQAMHGGQATNDRSDAHTSVGLLRGGLLPQASVSPAKRRATRDLLRRRMPLARTRAALLAHIQPTNRPYPLPAMGKQVTYQANRNGIAERFSDSAIQKSLAPESANSARVAADWR